MQNLTNSGRIKYSSMPGIGFPRVGNRLAQLSGINPALIGTAILVVIFEIIGLALYPTVFSSITSANSGGAIVGSSGSLVKVVIPLFYALILVIVPAAAVVAVAKGFGGE